MKKGDWIWIGVLGCLVLFLILPFTHQLFILFTARNPYLAAFAKFSVLATMGELLALRIQRRDWGMPSGVVYRFIIWGLIGIVITLMFQIFIAGVASAVQKGYLPGAKSPILQALYISLIMNFTFAPTFMAFHKFTDGYIDLYFEGKRNIRISEITERIDWKVFVDFVILKTIPLFWVPAHFITFLLPAEYRVLFAAALSLALGVLLALRKGVLKNV